MVREFRDQHDVAANPHRRHLSALQRAIAAAKAREIYDEQAKERQKRKPDSVSQKVAGQPMPDVPEPITLIQRIKAVRANTSLAMQTAKMLRTDGHEDAAKVLYRTVLESIVPLASEAYLGQSPTLDSLADVIPQLFLNGRCKEEQAKLMVRVLNGDTDDAASLRKAAGYSLTLVCKKRLNN